MRTLNIFFYLFVVMFFCSCEDFFDQVVEVEIPDHVSTLAPTFNYNSKDSIHSVYVSQTLGSLDNESVDIVENATVLLKEDGVDFKTFPYFENGFYTVVDNDMVFKPGSVYTLNVSAPGYEDVVATTIAPALVQIENVTYEKDETVDFDGNRADKLTIEISDPEGVENFYSATLLADFGDYFYYSTTLHSNDLTTEDIANGAVFRDKSFDGKKHKLVFYVSKWNFGYQDIEMANKVVVNLHSWSKDKYLFEKSLDAYENSQDNPFAEPSIVHSNCSSEAGIFSIVVSDEYEIIF